MTSPRPACAVLIGRVALRPSGRRPTLLELLTHWRARSGADGDDGTVRPVLYRHCMPDGGAVTRVYVSLPLSGPAAQHGREMLRGARLAAERVDIELACADTGGRAAVKLAGAHANAAAADPAAVAYLGDFSSRQVRSTAPILERAGILQVAPIASLEQLRSETLIRLVPGGHVGGATIGDWLLEVGAGDLLLVHDYGDDYAEPLAADIAAGARERGVEVRMRRVWDWDERAEDDLPGALAVLYVGVAGTGADQMFAGLHALKSELWLLGTEGIAEPWLVEALPDVVAQRMRFFVPNKAPLALYGFEAMGLILDAFSDAGHDRAGVVAASRKPGGRAGAIGRYAIEPDGQVTGTSYGRLAVVGGRLVWDT